MVRSQMEENAVAITSCDYTTSWWTNWSKPRPSLIRLLTSRMRKTRPGASAAGSGTPGLDFRSLLKYVGRARETYMKEEIEPAAASAWNSLVIDQFAQDEG